MTVSRGRQVRLRLTSQRPTSRINAGIDLDHALRLAGELEDAETIRRLEWLWPPSARVTFRSGERAVSEGPPCDGLSLVP
jgi:hypothetical protein